MENNSPAAFDLLPINEVTCPQVFYDGFSRILVSDANAKITLDQVVSVNDGRAQQKPMVTLVIPTATMIQLCKNFLENAEQRELTKNSKLPQKSPTSSKRLNAPKTT